MLFLIVSRAIQGFGAASIFAISFTIVGDVFPLDQRAKVQGVLSAVWGVAGLIGPLLGGILIDLLSWHWIFYINIPFGLIALVVLDRSLKERVERHETKIDYAGTLTLSAAIIIFLGIFTLQDFVPLPFAAYVVLSLILTVVLIAAFVRIERRASEPIIPFSLLTRSSIFINLTVFLAAVVMMCCDVYLPIFLQNVQGYSATVSGLLMLPITVTWLAVSFSLGRLMRRFGGKRIMVMAGVLLIVTSLLFLLINRDTQLLPLILIFSVSGFAVGGSFSTSTIIIQDSVGYEQRGAAVSLNALLKTLGQTVGMGILGGAYNLSITHFFATRGMPEVNPSNLYSNNAEQIGSAAASTSPAPVGTVAGALTPELITQSLMDATHVLFIICLVVAVLSLIASLLIPKDSH
jgi:MFS family permease